jgi:hypothetical protein
MILALCLDRPELAEDWLGLEDDIFTQTCIQLLEAKRV